MAISRVGKNCKHKCSQMEFCSIRKMAIIEQKTRTRCLRLCAYFQVITRMKKKKRQTIFTVCRVSFYKVSEWGDSNARPLRPERSALPTALHSVTCCCEDTTKIDNPQPQAPIFVQFSQKQPVFMVKKQEKQNFSKNFPQKFAQSKPLPYLCTRKTTVP